MPAPWWLTLEYTQLRQWSNLYFEVVWNQMNVFAAYFFFILEWITAWAQESGQQLHVLVWTQKDTFCSLYAAKTNKTVMMAINFFFVGMVKRLTFDLGGFAISSGPLCWSDPCWWWLDQHLPWLIPWVFPLQSGLSTWPRRLWCFQKANWKCFRLSWRRCCCCCLSSSSCSSSTRRRSSALSLQPGRVGECFLYPCCGTAWWPSAPPADTHVNPSD